MSRYAGNKNDPNYILALQLQDSPVQSICIYLYCIYFLPFLYWVSGFKFQGDVVCHCWIWPAHCSTWLRGSYAGLGQWYLLPGGHGYRHSYVGTFGDAATTRPWLSELFSIGCCKHRHLGHHLADGFDDSTSWQGSQKCCHDYCGTTFSWDFRRVETVAMACAKARARPLFSKPAESLKWNDFELRALQWNIKRSSVLCLEKAMTVYIS